MEFRPIFRVDITTHDGSTRSAGVDYPHGHHLDPMMDAEVEAKFRELASRKLPREKVDAALGALWGFDEALNADGIFEIVDIETGVRSSSISRHSGAGEAGTRNP